MACGVPHTNHALIVNGGRLPRNKLEFCTNLITDTLRIGGIEFDRCGIRGRAAEGIERIRLNLVQKRLVMVTCDVGGVGAASECHACGGAELCGVLEHNIIIGGKVLCIGNRLGFNASAVKIGADIPQVPIVHIRRNFDCDVIAAHAGIFRLRKSIGCLVCAGA